MTNDLCAVMIRDNSKRVTTSGNRYHATSGSTPRQRSRKARETVEINKPCCVAHSLQTGIIGGRMASNKLGGFEFYMPSKGQGQGSGGGGSKSGGSGSGGSGGGGKSSS